MPKIALAPMEGVVDASVRDLLTAIGDLDFCVTEFVRVTQQLLPKRVFYRLAPELHHGCRTRSRTQVHVQLLGSDANMLAVNARRAAQLGAPVIDLNFGCPAKTVNRHQGGAVLLQTPERLYQIVAEVQQALVDLQVPVHVKMRLGYADAALSQENVDAVIRAGAASVCIHARTKVQGYKPPAHWHLLAPLREQLAQQKIPLIANGDIIDLQTYLTCRQASGCEDVMLGRGLLADPFLAVRLKAYLQTGHWDGVSTWPQRAAVLVHYADLYAPLRMEKIIRDSLKQWLALMKGFAPAAAAFETLKRMRDLASLLDALRAQACPKTLVQLQQTIPSPYLA
ncbi:tRNA-dihydrouridine synthase C [Allopseudospirillum japonicum]|uniref:tRNA-dihydrouridine(16) synthase n=1 Tax=Allopseudospirillum japonicum TaxID=64971 RepID=A0A1H6RKD1_9GAMM|nr:tRNA-dihydrouridine synthase [Allopseudospirillum japonicum]SEI56249.1 tRNA-dihydrouridine synthase C [Allopseudospirillum japonicum]